MEAAVSDKVRKRARKYKLEPEELAFAELIALGWDKEDAWAIAKRTGATWTKKALSQEITALLNKEGVQTVIQESQSVIAQREAQSMMDISDEDSTRLLERATNKETKIVELQARLEKTNDPKLWLAINQQIIDVTRMKQDDVKTEDNTIHYYIPVNYPTSCQNCLLNPKNKSTLPPP